MVKAISLIAIIFTLAACARRAPATYTNHTGPGWAAQCDKQGCFVVARDNEALDAALKAVCKLCAVNPLGEAYTLERLAQ